MIKTTPENFCKTTSPIYAVAENKKKIISPLIIIKYYGNNVFLIKKTDVHLKLIKTSSVLT